MAMVAKSACVRLIHSLTFYETMGRSDEHDGAFLAAMGDRDGDQDPTWVEVPPQHFRWAQHTLPKDTSDSSAIATFYSRRENRLKMFDATGEEMEDTATWVPVYPIIPMEVAAAAAKREKTKPMTHWELYLQLNKLQD